MLPPGRSDRAGTGRARIWIATGLTVLAMAAILLVVQHARSRPRPIPPPRVVAWGTAPMSPDASLGLVHCEAYLNGRGPYLLVVDSGAPTLFVGPRVSQELGLHVEPQRLEIASFGGPLSVRCALLERLEMGSVVLERVVTAVVSDSVPLMEVFDGILGTPVLRGARMAMDFEQAVLRVEPSGGPVPAGRELDLRMGRFGHLLARVRLDDLPVWALLDTGANMTFVSPRWLRSRYPGREVVQIPLPVVGMGQRVEDMHLTILGCLEMAGRRERAPAVVSPDVEPLNPRIGRRFDLVIGMDWLRRMRRLVVDYPAGRAWVEWLTEAEPAAGRDGL